MAGSEFTELGTGLMHWKEAGTQLVQCRRQLRAEKLVPAPRRSPWRTKPARPHPPLRLCSLMCGPNRHNHPANLPRKQPAAAPPLSKRTVAWAARAELHQHGSLRPRPHVRGSRLRCRRPVMMAAEEARKIKERKSGSLSLSLALAIYRHTAVYFL